MEREHWIQRYDRKSVVSSETQGNIYVMETEASTRKDREYGLYPVSHGRFCARELHDPFCDLRLSTWQRLESEGPVVEVTELLEDCCGQEGHGGDLSKTSKPIRRRRGSGTPHPLRRYFSSRLHSFIPVSTHFCVSGTPGPRNTRLMRHSLCSYFIFLSLHSTSCRVRPCYISQGPC